MKPNEITAQIVHAAYRVHTQLGPGLLETVPEQRGDPVGSGKDFRAESAENAERAQGACGVGEAVDMAIPPKTARNLLRREFFIFSAFIDLRLVSLIFVSLHWRGSRQGLGGNLAHPARLRRLRLGRGDLELNYVSHTMRM